MVGTPGADRLAGTRGADVICGRGGPDRIDGRGGDDRLIGGAGSDTLIGGRGNDILVGGPGGDDLRGGLGADRLHGGTGRDSCRDNTVTISNGCAMPRPTPAGPIPQFGLPAVRFPPSRQLEPDLAPPHLQSIEFANENVEISQGDWWVELSISAWDESGTASVVVGIDGPDGAWREVSFGENPQFAELSRKLEVPATTPVGDYRVSAVTVVDKEGNSASYDLDWLDERGLDAEFEVYDGPDREAPNLAGLSFAPTPIDTSNGPVTVQIPIELLDPGSGVESVGLKVAHPTSKPGEERIYTVFPTLVSGTERDGTWLATITLPSGSTAGFYSVKELAFEDLDHHWDVFNASSLEDHGYPGGFTQVGEADATRPEITSFSINTQVLHTATGERELVVDIGVDDDWSGINGWLDPVSDVHFSLTPPDWPISWGMSGSAPQLVAGTDLDGTWRLTHWLESGASIGTWRVRRIVVTDRAGNTTRLEDGSLEDFEAQGWDLTFENLP